MAWAWSTRPRTPNSISDVAIKFLPHQIAACDEERERFKIEGQAAAALNHPNIATIHNVEEHEGEMFIVMEYI